MMITMMMAMFTMIKMTVMMAMASFQVRIDYKGQRFVGENGKEISGLLVSIFTHIISSVRSVLRNNAPVCASIKSHKKKCSNYHIYPSKVVFVHIVLLSYF